METHSTPVLSISHCDDFAQDRTISSFQFFFLTTLFLGKRTERWVVTLTLVLFTWSLQKSERTIRNYECTWNIERLQTWCLSIFHGISKLMYVVDFWFAAILCSCCVWYVLGEKKIAEKSKAERYSVKWQYLKAWPCKCSVWSPLWSDMECTGYLPIHLATDKVLISTALRNSHIVNYRNNYGFYFLPLQL